MKDREELEMLMDELNAGAETAPDAAEEIPEMTAEETAKAVEETVEEEIAEETEALAEAEEAAEEAEDWEEFVSEPGPAEGETDGKKPVSRRRKILAAVAALLILATLGAFVLPALLKKDKKEVVMTVNGHEILKDEFEYYIYDMIDYYGQYYGSTFFASDAAFQSLKDYVCEYLNEHYVIYSWAEQNGYQLTDEVIEESRKMIEDVKANYESEEDFQQILASNHLTEDLYLRLLNTDSVVTAFSNALSDGTSGLYSVSDEEARAAVESLGILGAKRILILSGASEEENVEKETLAYQLYDRLMAGEDFDELMKEYGEDPGMEGQPNGYTFGQGEMVQEFYDGTAALQIGEISKPVVSDYGWHIILRTEPDLEEARLRAMNELINKGLDEQLEKAGTVYNTELLESMKYTDYIAVAAQ